MQINQPTSILFLATFICLLPCCNKKTLHKNTFYHVKQFFIQYLRISLENIMRKIILYLFHICYINEYLKKIILENSKIYINTITYAIHTNLKLRCLAENVKNGFKKAMLLYRYFNYNFNLNVNRQPAEIGESLYIVDLC